MNKYHKNKNRGKSFANKLNVLYFHLLSPECSCHKGHLYPSTSGCFDCKPHSRDFASWRLHLALGETSSCLTNTLTISRCCHRNPRVQVFNLHFLPSHMQSWLISGLQARISKKKDSSPQKETIVLLSFEMMSSSL